MKTVVGFSTVQHDGAIELKRVRRLAVKFFLAHENDMAVNIWMPMD